MSRGDLKSYVSKTDVFELQTGKLLFSLDSFDLGVEEAAFIEDNSLLVIQTKKIGPSEYDLTYVLDLVNGEIYNIKIPRKGWEQHGYVGDGRRFEAIKPLRANLDRFTEGLCYLDKGRPYIHFLRGRAA